ncbi:hypothetical protein SSX86_021945 [Deinandra increscens subsp. villosa]|uniref:NAB domain-containing protein n=1 Tax=Deinandra increscens subsp. villosa TaxID=3103831 RepID=A0AAP0GRX0_9ASTR
MGKHRLRNRMKSIAGSLIDPDKDEQLKGSNTETEDSYRKILEILKGEDQEDKNRLMELVEEFHNGYRSIYEQYEHITGELKEKVQSKKGKQSSSSSSSDSDSDNSSNKNGKLKDKMIHMVANTEIDELKRNLAVETEEKEALNSRLKETENMLNQMKLQSDRLLEENSKILAENRELNQKIEDIKKEKTSLMLEKDTSMTTIEELSAIVDQLKGEKDGFESELQNMKMEFSEMKEKLITTEDEVSNLIRKLETTELENQSLFKKLADQRTEIEMQKEDELLALQKKYEEKIDNLQKELETISTHKQESDDLIEHLRDEITNMNGELERSLEENGVHVAKIKQLEEKLDETSNKIQNDLLSKEHIIEQLEETIEDLRSDLEINGDEVHTLTETVRNLEVKIRLSTQKLRVTEQLLNETEHEHAAKEEKMHQENKSLMEKISTLSQTITDIKREVQYKVIETLTGVDSLSVKFEEDYGHVRTRVIEIKNEIQATQIQLKQMKEDMKQKFQEMVTKLKLSEGENERLMKSLEDMKMENGKKDEKINELEATIHVKEECISGFCEDKREAIRQLCIWADYHRDRSDHLQQQLLKTTTGGRRLTVR